MLEIDKIRKDINWLVSQIKCLRAGTCCGDESSGGGTPVNQDNKDIFKYISIESESEEIYKVEALTYINSLPEHEVDEHQSLWFVILHFGSLELPPAKYIYKVSNLGKGTYGVAQTQIAFTDLELISKENVLVTDIENQVGTQIIDFGDMGADEVWEHLNGQVPSILLQSQAVGYRLFKTLNADYLFLGPEGTYGFADLQTVEADFQELSNTSNLILAPLAYSGVKILNELGEAQFQVTEYMEFQGTTFDIPNKRVIVNPLVGGAIFVSDTVGDDGEAIIENRGKPFKSLNAAMDAFWLNPGINYIEILDSASYTTNRPLNNGTTRTFDLRGERACTVTITTTGVYCGANNQIINFNLLKGTLNLAPTSNTTFGLHPSARPNVTIMVANMSVNAFLRKSPSLTFDMRVSGTHTVTGSDGIVGGSSGSTNTNLIINNIVFVGAGSCLVGNNAGVVLNIDFNTISHNNTFVLLQTGSTTTTINHGGISGSYGGANFLYMQSPAGRLDINYKAGFSISSNLSLQIFNSANLNFTVTGICNYVNSDQLIVGNNLTTNTVTFINANVTCKILVAGRSTGAYKLINSNVKITGTRFANLQVSDVDGGPGIPGSFADPTFIFEGTNYILCTTDDLDLITYLDVMANIPTVDMSNGVLYTNGRFDRSTIVVIENPLNQYYDTIQRQIVIVNEVEEIANQTLNPLKTYFIDGELTLGASDKINVPATGLNITGYGFDRSIIKSTTAGHTMFKSEVGGSGDLNLDSLTLRAEGAGSIYFDLEDATGFHAVELVKVNFNEGNIGVINGYRQGLWSNVGLFGVDDGLTFEGTWLGGFRNDQTIVRTFGSSGVLFRKGSATLFVGRFLTDINADLPVGASLSDFDAVNFNADRLYQIKDAQITRAGVVDDTQNYTGTITHTSAVSDWQGNTGIKNSPISPYGIRTFRLSEYASDALATIGGIPTGEVYRRPDGLLKINNGIEVISNNVQSTLTYAASMALDYNTTANIHLLPITGNLTITAIDNKAIGKEKSIIISADASNRATTFPAWTWIGPVLTTIPAGKKATVYLYCSGTGTADVLASYNIQL